MRNTINTLTFVLGLAAVIAVSPVHAVKGNDNPGNPGNNGIGGPPIGNGGNGGAGGLASQLQGQAQGQLQGQLQGQAQGQAAIGVGVGIAGSSSTSGSTSGATAGNVGNTSSQSVVVTDSGQMRYSGDYTVKSTGIAPDIIAQPTAPCRIGVAAGGGWIGGALSIGGSVEDEGCTRRENARVLAGLGKSAAAVLLMCKDEEVASVLPECQSTQPAAPVEPQVSYNPTTRTTIVSGFQH